MTMGVATTLDAVDEARRVTHDQLIAMMGDRRLGGVTWRTASGEQARDIVSAAMDFEPRWAGCLRKLEEWPEAVLVVATAPGLPPS